ncbi:hypothetical protein GCM10010462_09350 [Microbacterium dextranolyticum]|uniref:Uncharacterized protein n=1 Tax=Microbacterium dextranolyticum TaxID=36806 RepID=A0A9W6HKC5_9MICO|nr:hypothetical protein GCM10017591_03920 [Microbacterium dextranolyticum]
MNAVGSSVTKGVIATKSNEAINTNETTATDTRFDLRKRRTTNHAKAIAIAAIIEVRDADQINAQNVKIIDKNTVMRRRNKKTSGRVSAATAPSVFE